VTYLRGRRAEYRAAADLERAGYLVIRSSGSHSPVDLVAVGPSGVRLVQVKTDSESRMLRPSELEAVREELRALPRPPGVAYELWVGRTVGRRWQWITREVVQ
jgi:Holliday junction resolvase